MKIEDAVESVDLKFKSGNEHSVEKTIITKEEWDTIKNYIVRMEIECAQMTIKSFENFENKK